MATPATPQNFNISQGNRQVYVSWNLTTNATGYTVQRSTDGINYSTLASPTTPYYLDTTVAVGTQYYYQTQALGSPSNSAFTTALSIVPTPNGEMSLAEIRLRAQQRCDRVGSNFVTTSEWNSYINQSLFELYDLLIMSDLEYYVAPFAFFNTVSGQGAYGLPDGLTLFTNSANQSFVAPPFYKLLGLDLGVQNANNAYVSVRKFNWFDRNKFVYPNTASTIYGVFNLQYRLMGNNIQFIPSPSGNQPIRISYIPRMTTLLQDTDYTANQGINGWLEYVIVDAAIKAMQKEESDVAVLAAQKMGLIKRIEETATNRDAGLPDTISDVRGSGFGNGQDNAGGGFQGGWALFPASLPHNIANHLLGHTIFAGYTSLAISAAMLLTYIGYLQFRQLRRSVLFAAQATASVSTFDHHIAGVIGSTSEEKMIRTNTAAIIASMKNHRPKWDGSKVQLVAKSMRPVLNQSNSAARAPRLSIVCHCKASISVSEIAAPFPAGARFFNLIPKTFHKLNNRIKAYLSQRRGW